MATKAKSPAKKEFCVWADYVRRVYQHVEAANPKHAYDIAKGQPECWEPCDLHDNNGYRLSNEVQELATEEFVCINSAKNCRTCGSEIVETINESNFREGECGPCEFKRYKIQPKLVQECQTQLDNWRMLRDGEWNASPEGITIAIQNLQSVLRQAYGTAK